MLGQSTGFSSQGDASRKVSPKRKGNLVVELSRVCGF